MKLITAVIALFAILGLLTIMSGASVITMMHSSSPEIVEQREGMIDQIIMQNELHAKMGEEELRGMAIATYNAMGFLYVVFGVIYMAMAWLIYKRKTWARTLAIIFSILAMIPLFSFPILGTVFGIILLIILFQNSVKEEFTQEAPEAIYP